MDMNELKPWKEINEIKESKKEIFLLKCFCISMSGCPYIGINCSIHCRQWQKLPICAPLWTVIHSRNKCECNNEWYTAIGNLGRMSQLIDKSDRVLVSECNLSYVPVLHVNTWASSHHYALHRAKLHMHIYAHCKSMCEPVNAVVVKISFNGESRAMIYGSCVKLHDFFDGRDHEKALYKIFVSKIFWWFFFSTSLTF